MFYFGRLSNAVAFTRLPENIPGACPEHLALTIIPRKVKIPI